MDRETIISELKGGDAHAFLENHIFDRVPQIFENDRSAFIIWKRTLASSIEVDPASITVIGSAAVGLSLSPYKNFKPFDAKSDVDVAVVSNYHFTIAWRYLRMNSTKRMKVDPKTKTAWDEHVNRYIYWGTIATDRLLGVLPFGFQWLNSRTQIAKVAPTNGRTVNLRIYADFESLRAYQLMSINKLRDNLFEGQN